MHKAPDHLAVALNVISSVAVPEGVSGFGSPPGPNPVAGRLAPQSGASNFTTSKVTPPNSDGLHLGKLNRANW